MVNHFYAIVEQEDDVILPEVPTHPVPELPPEAAKADPGTAAVLYDHQTEIVLRLFFLLLL